MCKILHQTQAINHKGICYQKMWNGTLERRLECLNMFSFMSTREDLKLNIENGNVVKMNSRLVELRSKLTI